MMEETDQKAINRNCESCVKMLEGHSASVECDGIWG